MGEQVETKKGAWRTVAVLGGAKFVDLAESNVVSATFPSIRQSLGLNVGHLGTILAAKGPLGLVFGPLWAVQGSTILGFYVTWLADERGFSPSLATMSLAPLLVGSVTGNLVGGSVGDWAASRSPRHGRLLMGQLCMACTSIATYLHTQIEWGSTAVFWALGFAQGLIAEMGAAVALAPIRLAVTLPEIRATGSAVYDIVGKPFGALTVLLIGKLALRLGLTTVFFWTLTVAYAVHALLWFAIYPVYHKDVAKMQQVLASRRAELTAGSESG